MRLGVVSVALVALLSACVAEENAPPPRAVVVNGPPPAPVHETRPQPPSPSATWVAGYWHWSGMQYTWIPGHWEDGQRGTWHAPSYSFHDGTYFYEPGGWGPR
jgi:YXWGXW repeat-containing protein